MTTSTEATIDTHSLPTQSKLATWICLAWCILLGTLLHAPAVTAGPSTLHETFDVAAEPGFDGYRQVMTSLARKYRPGRANDFCIVGYQISPESKIAWVMWKQRNELILWEAGEADIDTSRRKLNLRKDVVSSEEAVRGSTYLVTRAWVASVARDCASHGTRFHLKK